jgi:ABC-type phosphate/phosphonate transport system substrate-binding protein
MMTSLLIFSPLLAGCTSGADDDTIRIAFKIKDDYSNADENPQVLADFIADQTGRPVEIYPISNDGAAIEALRFGHADLAFLDGGAAWVAWQQHGLEAIAADQKSDGTTQYSATAWVRNDSDIRTLADLQGRDSCHTGWLKSAGMLMPMGYLIGEGLVNVSGNTSDIESLRTAIENHFGTASIPVSGELYYGYSGAFRCMSEGAGDVAFVKTTSYTDHCSGNEWCGELSDYRMLSPAFGQVPSHPVMVNPSILDSAEIESLRSALLALNSEADGAEILANVLETPGMSEVTSESHLGSYSDAISNIPGIDSYFDEKYSA